MLRVPYPVLTIAVPYVFNFAHRHTFVKNFVNFTTSSLDGLAVRFWATSASHTAYSFFKHFTILALCSMAMITNQHRTKKSGVNKLIRGCSKLNIFNNVNNNYKDINKNTIATAQPLYCTS